MLILFLSILAGSIFLYYDNLQTIENSNKKLVRIPQNAFLVYNTSNAIEQLSRFEKSIFYSRITNEINSIQLRYKYFTDCIKHIAKNKHDLPLTLSVHLMPNKNCGCIIYLNKENEGTKKIIKKTLSDVKNYNRTTKDYLGHKIVVINAKDETNCIYCLEHNQQLIITFSYDLMCLFISEIINGMQKSSIADEWNLENQSNVWINTAVFYEALSSLTGIAINDQLKNKISYFCQFLNLNVRIMNESIVCSGFGSTSINSSKTYFIDVYKGQNPKSITILPYIPKDTIMIQWFGFNDTEKLFELLRQHRNATDNFENSNHKLLFPTLNSLMPGEIFLNEFDSLEDCKRPQIMLIKTTDSDFFIKTLCHYNILSQQLTAESRSLEYFEVQENFFKSYICNISPEFDVKFIAKIDKCIILANDTKSLFHWYDSYSKDEVWSESIDSTNWINNTSDQANFNLFIDCSKYIPSLTDCSEGNFKELIEKNADLLKSLRIRLQLINQQNEYSYITISINYKT